MHSRNDEKVFSVLKGSKEWVEKKLGGKAGVVVGSFE
jgi:hypothetical protein